MARLANTLATGGALVAILLVFGPISGASEPGGDALHGRDEGANAAERGGVHRRADRRGIAGAILANATFELPAVTWSMTARAGAAQLLCEAVATLRAARWRHRHRPNPGRDYAAGGRGVHRRGVLVHLVESFRPARR